MDLPERIRWADLFDDLREVAGLRRSDENRFALLLIRSEVGELVDLAVLGALMDCLSPVKSPDATRYGRCAGDGDTGRADGWRSARLRTGAGRRGCRAGFYLKHRLKSTSSVLGFQRFAGTTKPHSSLMRSSIDGPMESTWLNSPFRTVFPFALAFLVSLMNVAVGASHEF